MKRLLKLLHIIFLITYLYGCSTDDSTPEQEIAFFSNLLSATLWDVENNNNLGDLYLEIEFKETEGTSAFRVFVMETTDFAGYDLETLSAMGPEYYTLKSNITNKMSFRLDEDQRILGDKTFNTEITYTARIVMIINDELNLVSQIPSRTTTDEHPLNGDYTGNWQDNIYDNFQVSTKLTFSNGSLNGPFYYSPTYTSCCGGTTDGSVTFEVEDGIIPSFIYNQDLALFMGGACPGLYIGEGQIVDYLTIELVFTGNDCEGEHTNGKLTLNKSPE